MESGMNSLNSDDAREMLDKAIKKRRIEQLPGVEYPLSIRKSVGYNKYWEMFL
jgi:hypothetical protein